MKHSGLKSPFSWLFNPRLKSGVKNEVDQRASALMAAQLNRFRLLRLQNSKVIIVIILIQLNDALPNFLYRYAEKVAVNVWDTLFQFHNLKHKYELQNNY
jgi:hypothetical protein